MYASNEARTSWLIERDDDSQDPIVALSHQKVNRGRLLRTPFAYRVDFTLDEANVARISIAISQTSINYVSAAR